MRSMMTRWAMAAVMGMLAAGQAEAGLVVQFTSASEPTSTGSNSFGFSFTTGSAVTVADLDSLTPGTGGGAVRLYDAAGTTLASATVLATDPTESTGGFTYFVHALDTPLALAANTMYFVAGDFGVGDVIPTNATDLTIAGGITYDGGVSMVGLGNPTSSDNGPGFNPAYFSVNFDLAPAVATPEPSTLAMIAAGVPVLLGMGYRRSRRNRSA